MVMTIHKLSAGDGYTYLTRSVAGGDVQQARGQSASDYYTAEGNPPGEWIGRGAHLLDLEGKTVAEAAMKALYGAGMHPDADRIIAAYLEKHVRPGMSPEELTAIGQAAQDSAYLGRPLYRYKALEDFDKRVADRLAVLSHEVKRPATPAEVAKIKAEESRRPRGAVAGFDVVFAPVKSAAVLWALDRRAWVRQAVVDAHKEALGEAMQLLEDHAAFTRVGTNGVAQIATHGLIAAAFDHYDSRTGDPNLHTHVAISTKVKAVAGKWRSLDARGLYRMTVAASERYNTAFEIALARRIGARFEARAGTPKGKQPVREIAGIPVEAITLFSRRREALEARYEQLVRGYRREHGHDPDKSTCHKLARQANLDTRQGKKAPRSLQAMRNDWTAQLTNALGPTAVEQIASAVPHRALGKTPAHASAGVGGAVDIGELAAGVVARVAEGKATWTVWNVQAETERQIRDTVPLITAEVHRDLVAEVVKAACSPTHSVRIAPPTLLNEPAALRRADGVSIFEEHASTRYTSTAVLDAEQRLLSAARTAATVGLAGPVAAARLADFETYTGLQLDEGQRRLVLAFATDNRLLTVGIGPAGAGKTAAMKAFVHVVSTNGHRVMALAPSAAAASVLGKELGVAAENTAKFVYEYTHGTKVAQLWSGRDVPPWKRDFVVNPGDVILVDEAGLAGTFTLDTIRAIATHRGAVVRLLGDPQQFTAVESGGALRLIAHDVGATELNALHRFHDPLEAAATLKIRDGDTTGLDFYEAGDRIRAGSKHAMIDALYTGWRHDIQAGKTSLMTAVSTTDTIALSARARTDRITDGHVEPEGVRLADGNLAGQGDWIITRDNNRLLQTNRGKDFVHNGDLWHVTHRHHDGSLTARHLDHHGTVTLPADYVAHHVELGYATTGLRSQGSTVTTGHTLATEHMTREAFYVTTTRATHGTTIYAATHHLPDTDPSHNLDHARTDPDHQAARELLEQIITRDGTEHSATETIRHTQQHAETLAVLAPRHLHAAHTEADHHYRARLPQALGNDLAEALIRDVNWPGLVRAIYAAEQQGWQSDDIITAAHHRQDPNGPVPTADTFAASISTATTEQPAPPRLAQPTTKDAARYAHLIHRTTGAKRSDLAISTAIAPSPAPADGVLGAWRTTAWALKAAEQQGYDPELLLGQVSRGTNLIDLPNLIAERVQAKIQATDPQPPWLHTPHRNISDGPELTDYITASAQLIIARVNELAEHAATERPAWTTTFGHAPTDADAYASWQSQLGIAAAYREQHGVNSNDPEQPLGPYPMIGTDGHDAYWHAASSIVTARAIDYLADLGATAGAKPAVVFLGLTENERAAIAQTMAQRLGPFRLGGGQVDMTQVAYARHLNAALNYHGHQQALEAIEKPNQRIRLGRQKPTHRPRGRKHDPKPSREQQVSQDPRHGPNAPNMDPSPNDHRRMRS